jgi:hypothetical protein
MAGKRKEVVREIEPELLDVEDRAKYLEDTFVLRGCVKKIAGFSTDLNGMVMRPNALLNKDAIGDELLALREVIDEALKKVS